MKRLSPIQKETMLKRINDIPTPSIHKFISSGEFTLEECLENGLDSLKHDEINLLQLEDEIKIKAAEEANKKEEEDQEFYDKINNEKVIIQEIQKALISGRVTEEGLLNNTIIDEALLQKIKNYTKQFHPSKNNDVALIAGTDIFFFGKSGSGKSCVLASIFNFAADKGLFIDNLISINGINYKNVIVREMQHGILPQATPATKDAVTYITTELHKDGEVNPLNFIEMSGEFFSQAAQNPDDTEETIDAHGYLSNSNRKLLFFIVDYKMYEEGELTSGNTQAQDFNLILSQLDIYKKALKNTYCVYIIVNKSDKFPEGVSDKNAFAQDFFIENFKGVYNNLKVKQEKHGFALHCFHFSIGELIFANSYLKAINYECPKSILDSISKQAARKKKAGWLKKIFSGDEE